MGHQKHGRPQGVGQTPPRHTHTPVWDRRVPATASQWAGCQVLETLFQLLFLCQRGAGGAGLVKRYWPSESTFRHLGKTSGFGKYGAE